MKDFMVEELRELAARAEEMARLIGAAQDMITVFREYRLRSAEDARLMAGVMTEALRLEATLKNGLAAFRPLGARDIQAARAIAKLEVLIASLANNREYAGRRLMKFGLIASRAAGTA